MKVITEGGAEITLGTVEVSPTIGIVDYSRRETDDFGVTTLVKRGFGRRMSVRIALPFEDVDGVQQQLAALRATPAQWIADDRFAWLNVEGFYKDFELDLAVPPLSYCTLTVEGLAETEPGADAGGDPAPEGRSSTLRLVQPITVTDAVLAYSSLAEADYPQWSAVTNYQIGDRVIRAHRIWESAADDNAGNDPAAGAAEWLNAGPTNRWAMFDQAIGTATTGAGAITVTLNVADADAVALLDVTAATVRVQAPGYDQTRAVDAGATLFLDLPMTTGQITVTITGPGQVAAGTLIVGRLADLGITEASPKAGIIDYSRKEVDDFGEVTIVPRAWAKRMSGRALIRTDAIDAVANRLAAVRATPALWIGDEGTDSLTIFGFYREFSIEVGETVSTLSLNVEGLSQAAPKGALTPNWTDVIDNDPARPKPQDGATVGAPPGTNVGGVPAEDVAGATVEIGQIRVDVTALQETYGDTEAAAASAAVAEQAKIDALAAAGETDADRTAVAGMATTVQQLRDETSGLVGVAQGHALVAQDKAGEASASAGQSSASAIEAAGSASAANNSKVQAQSLKDQTQSLADAAQSSSVAAGSHAAAALQNAKLSAQIGGAGIVKNPVFADFDTASPVLPADWNEWSPPAIRSRVAGAIGPYAIYEQTSGGQQAGFRQFLSNMGPGKYLVEGSVRLKDGPITGAGLYIVSYSASGTPLNSNGLHFANARTSDGRQIGDGTADYNRLLHFSFIFDAAHLDTRTLLVHGMTGWTGFVASPASKWLEWHRLNVKPITALEAAVLNDAGAVVEVGKRTMSFWNIRTDVTGLGNGATAFIEARAEATPGAVTSSVAVGAREVSIYNQVGENFYKTLTMQGGNAHFLGRLQAGATISQGSGSGWPVALKVKDFQVGDGDYVDFGTTLDALPTIDFIGNNLAPLNAGEAYNLYAENLTASGFTARLKINVPATPTNYSLNVDTAPGTGPTRQIDKSAQPDSATGSYTVAVRFTAGFFNATYNYQEAYGTAVFGVWAKKSGVWSKVATMSAAWSAGGPGKGFISTVEEASGTFQMGSGVQAVGITLDTGGVSLDDFLSLSWQAQGSGSGVRSATPNGQKSKVKVTPQ